MLRLVVRHEEKGDGIVVDHIQGTNDQGEVSVHLLVHFFDHPKPAVHTVDPEELETIDFPDSVKEDLNIEDEETEEGAENGED